MNAKEIITEWKCNHPDAPNPPDDIERLIGLLVGNGDKEQAATLAQTIVEKRDAQAIEAKRNELLKLREILHADRNDFLDDMSSSDIWDLALKADLCMTTFVKFVLSTWKSSFQKAIQNYQTAIKMLCNRWGFGDDITGMLQFILIDGNKYIEEYVDDDGFLQGESGELMDTFQIDWKLTKRSLMDNPEESAYDFLNILEEAGIYGDCDSPDRTWTSLLDKANGLEHSIMVETLICGAVCICFHPDAIHRLSDAEIVLRVLYCFLNGATNNDTAVRYGLLRKRIAELEDELSEMMARCAETERESKERILVAADEFSRNQAASEEVFEHCGKELEE